MQCPNCGSDNQQDRFCTVCGATIVSGQAQPESAAEPAQAPVQPAPVQQQAPQQPAPPPGVAQQPAPQQYAAQSAQPQAPKKRGCGCFVLGCLGVFLIVALLVLAAVGWYLRWPEQWGLVESPAEELFERSPNPWAAEALYEGYAEAGRSVEGLAFFVIPNDDSSSHTAYVLAEEAEGFTWSDTVFENPIEGLLIYTAASGAVDEYSIDRVAVDYRDAEGTQVAVMTAPTQALIDFAIGEISQEELFSQMNARTPDSVPIDIDLGGEE